MSSLLKRSWCFAKQAKGARIGAASLLFASLIAPAVSAPVEQLPPIPRLAERKDEFDATIREQILQALEKLQGDPQDATANGRLGMILHAHERYELAEPLYRRARLLDPDSFPWAYYLGVIQGPLGKQNEAAQTLRLAVALKRDYLPARMALAETLQKLGELAESRRMYSEILADHPQSASAYFGLGRVSWEEGEVAEAIRNYERACQLSPSLVPPIMRLGWPIEASRMRRNHENFSPDSDSIRRASRRWRTPCWRRLNLLSRKQATTCSKGLPLETRANSKRPLPPSRRY